MAHFGLTADASSGGTNLGGGVWNLFAAGEIVVLLLGSGLANVIVLALFAVGWALRYDAPTAPTPVPLVLSWAGMVLALVTGWLAGELADRLGVGVAPGSISIRLTRSPAGSPASRSHPHWVKDGSGGRRADDLLRRRTGWIALTGLQPDSPA